MEGNNNAPFTEWQKIVRTGESNSFVKKGEVYTTHACYRCPVCGKWSVTLKEFPVDNCWPFDCCVVLLQSPSHRGGFAKNFAPIERRSVEIDKEVLDSLPKETQERSDVVVKPQEVSVQNQLLDTIDEMIALLPQIPIEQRLAYADKIVEAINRTCKLIRGESC